MNYIEYGKEHNEVIVLLHGGGLSWWNYREVAEKLASNYHIILPILDGHAQSDADFTTIEDNAAEIINFINEKYSDSVLLIGGLSLGGQILLEILAQRSDICQYALIESALTVPSKFTYAMIKPVFGSCYGLIKQKWFSKLQFKSLKIKQELFEDYFRDTCGISKSNMIAFLEENAMYYIKSSVKNCSAKVYVIVGENENKAILKSAKIIHENLQDSVLHVLPKMHHGEFSINHADGYVNKLQSIIRG